ncbi:uncharacterized protein LOC126329078 [Schistocerca gregaria]|uniref:uncharacterized protein LOC126329078 n=1 Tax=Schistocerca gregaria TaxID=7010 RepID=UPI00211EFFE1|nr:uncharacterized protein LOC126329078 [Schistocerca gregaria]
MSVRSTILEGAGIEREALPDSLNSFFGLSSTVSDGGVRERATSLDFGQLDAAFDGDSNQRKLASAGLRLLALRNRKRDLQAGLDDAPAAGTSPKRRKRSSGPSNAEDEGEESHRSSGQEEAAPSPDSLADRAKKEMEEKNKRTIFVGNVAIDTKKKELKKFFSVFGTVESIRYRGITVLKPNVKRYCIMRNQLHPERESMHAYVVFKDNDSAKRALKANWTEFRGRHIRVDLAEKRPTKKEDYWNCVYVSGLPLMAEEEDLYEIFKVCGEISNVRIVRDRYYKVSKGYGYVQFNTRRGMYQALNMSKKVKYKGKLVHITLATPNSKVFGKKKRILELRKKAMEEKRNAKASRHRQDGRAPEAPSGRKAKLKTDRRPPKTKEHLKPRFTQKTKRGKKT